MIVKAGFIENVVTRRVYPNCSFLVSSRPWKISQMEIHEGTEIDLLLDLKGFSWINAVKFADNIFKNCYKDGDAIKQFTKDIAENKLATQLIHVPLLLLILAQVWYENERSLPSKLHELYILFLNLLADRMKEKYKKDPNHRQMRFTLGDTQSQFPSKISETSLVVNFGEGFLLSLCKVAHHFLLSSQKENSLVFEETELLKVLGDRGKEKLDVALDLSILSVTDSVSYLNRKTSVNFLHKTIQEFFTALCFIFSPEKLTNFIFSIVDLNHVQQNENIIVFLVGLMPELGNRVLGKVNELCKDDWETLRNAEELEMHCHSLYDTGKIYLRCKEEVIGENVLLNVSDLYLELFDYDLRFWSPSFLQSLDLRWPENSCFRDYVSVNLRGLTGLTYLRLRYLNCELYLPESDSLLVLIMFDLELSSGCCDVLGKTMTGYSKLKRLVIFNTDLHSCMLDLSNMTELTVLYMSMATLSSSCCDEFGRTLTCCTKLKRLELDSTDLHNCLLDLSNMTELTVLYMSEVTLSSSCCDVLGSTLAHCTKVQTLHIRKTDLHNCLLDLSNMTELTALDMWEVTLSSSCCDVLCRTLTHCTKLETLNLRDTNLYNCLLDLSNLAVLSELSVKRVTLSSSCCGVLRVLLTNCPKLETLNLMDINLNSSQLDMSKSKVLSTLSSCNCDVLGLSLTHSTQLKTLLMHQTCLYHCHLDLSHIEAYSSAQTLDGVALSSSCDVLDKTPIQPAQLRTLESSNTNSHNCQLDLSNMAELNTLVLANVTLSSCCCDVLGSTLKHCIQLKHLFLKNTDLYNCQLDLSNMTALCELTLDGVTLSSSCCDVLGGTMTLCTQLRVLTLKNTNLYNCKLDLTNMRTLSHIELRGVSLSSSACQVLELSYNQLEAANKHFCIVDNVRWEVNLLFFYSDSCNISVLSKLIAEFDLDLQSDPDSQSDIDFI